MRTILFIFLLLSSNIAYTQDFSRLSLEDAFTEASKTNKKVLAYFTAKWCGPCRTMEKDVFPNNAVQEKMQDFVAVKIDIDKDTFCMEKYQIEAVPTFVIFDSSENIVIRHLGALNTLRFLEFLACTQKQPELAKQDLGKLKKKWVRRPLPEFGVRIGISQTTVSHLGIKSKTSGNADIFFSLRSEKDRFLLRQGIGYASKGIKDLKLDYLQFPLDIGYTFYKPNFFGLPSGLCALITPYYARLLNQAQENLNRNDYGFRYGISYYLGETSKFEVILSSENGMISIIPDLEGKRKPRNRGVNLSFALTF